MLDIEVGEDTIRIGPHFSVNFQRTLRIPDDGNTYPLPPGLSSFPICRVEDYADRVPAACARLPLGASLSPRRPPLMDELAGRDSANAVDGGGESLLLLDGVQPPIEVKAGRSLPNGW